MYKSIVKGKGGIEAKVVADSIANGVRITTMELRYHRFIHGEFLTHRMFSRNSSSSRAIPVTKMIEQVEKDPAMPIHWGKNQAGMQANKECDEHILYPWFKGLEDEIELESKERVWENASSYSVLIAQAYAEAGYHKQIVNRLLEPFQFIKTVVTATEWDNFFKLRDHRDVQPEMQELARCMKQVMDESEPDELNVGDWHLPYITIEDYSSLTKMFFNDRENYIKALCKCSTSRCARVSYQKHDNTNPSIEDDLELYNQLAVRPFVDKRGNSYGENDPVHLSPLEHVATPMSDSQIVDSYEYGEWPKGISHVDRNGIYWSGNFRGFIQYRQLIENTK